jgi:LmbE family N-acetylglucosaminyl deacetylase
MKVLAISAHPDDETLGCGGTLLKHAEAGDSIYWIIATTPNSPAWPPEVIEAKAREVDCVASAYGMKDCVRLGFPATGLDTVPLSEVIESMRNAISNIAPEVVYLVHGGDVHSDHQIVYSSAMAVMKPFYMSRMGVRRIVSYETLSSTDAAAPGNGENFVPTIFSDISPYIERKLEIMNLYQTEVHSFPSPRSSESIKALARYRGATAALSHAEAFMLRRELV